MGNNNTILIDSGKYNKIVLESKNPTNEPKSIILEDLNTDNNITLLQNDNQTISASDINLEDSSTSTKLIVYPRDKQGIPGDSPELRVNSGFIQWKLTKDTEWNNLIALSELEGAKTLNELEDVLLDGDFKNLQTLLYDLTKGKWINSLLLLKDLVNGELNDENIIVWDADTETFIPLPLSESAEVFIDNDTLVGSNTSADPIKVNPTIIDQIEQNKTTDWGQIEGTLDNQIDLKQKLDTKLDDRYAHFKSAPNNQEPSTPTEDGGVIYFTTVHMEGSVKIIEHKMKDSLGNITVIKSFREVM